MKEAASVELLERPMPIVSPPTGGGTMSELVRLLLIEVGGRGNPRVVGGGTGSSEDRSEGWTLSSESLPLPLEKRNKSLLSTPDSSESPSNSEVETKSITPPNGDCGTLLPLVVVDKEFDTDLLIGCEVMGEQPFIVGGVDRSGTKSVEDSSSVEMGAGAGEGGEAGGVSNEMGVVSQILIVLHN